MENGLMKHLKMMSVFVCLGALTLSTAALADNDSSTYSNRSSVKRHQTVENSIPNGDNLLGMQLGPSVASSNFSVPSGETSPNLDTRTRPTFGMYFEHRILSNLSVRPELNYVQRGFSNTPQGANATTIDIAANYLELPVMAKGQIELGSFTPYALTGPFIGLLTGKGLTTTNSKGISNDVSIDNLVNTFNFGWNFGAGSSYAITRTIKADLGARYSMAFTNALANSQTNGNTSVKLNSVQVLAGLGFEM
jgi:opacity protein-like surface antigen